MASELVVWVVVAAMLVHIFVWVDLTLGPLDYMLVLMQIAVVLLVACFRV